MLCSARQLSHHITLNASTLTDSSVKDQPQSSESLNAADASRSAEFKALQQQLSKLRDEVSGHREHHDPHRVLLTAPPSVPASSSRSSSGTTENVVRALSLGSSKRGRLVLGGHQRPNSEEAVNRHYAVAPPPSVHFEAKANGTTFLAPHDEHHDSEETFSSSIKIAIAVASIHVGLCAAAIAYWGLHVIRDLVERRSLYTGKLGRRASLSSLRQDRSLRKMQSWGGTVVGRQEKLQKVI
jgi:hypothetical protein